MLFATMVFRAPSPDQYKRVGVKFGFNPEDWRNRAALRSLEKQIFDHLSALGFTPGDRAKLGLIEPKVGGKFEELMRRRDELEGGF